MNRYGAVLQDGGQSPVIVRDLVRREAKDSGWTLENSNEPDIGLVYCPPKHHHDSNGMD